MTIAEFNVQGMTCGHCAQAVSSEINKLNGVTNVEVNVESGVVKVTSEDSLNVDEVASAVDEAGYELVR